LSLRGQRKVGRGAIENKVKVRSKKGPPDAKVYPPVWA